MTGTSSSARWCGRCGIIAQRGRQAGPDLRHRRCGAQRQGSRVPGSDGILRCAARGRGSRQAAPVRHPRQPRRRPRPWGRPRADAWRARGGRHIFRPECPEDAHPAEAARVRALVQCATSTASGQFPETSTCGPVEAVGHRGHKIGILPVNSALFCQGDDDHAKLWVGRRCLDAGIEELRAARRRSERSRWSITRSIGSTTRSARTSGPRSRSNVDLILRGHLHETDVESVAGVMGERAAHGGRCRLPDPQMAEPCAVRHR